MRRWLRSRAAAGVITVHRDRQIPGLVKSLVLATDLLQGAAYVLSAGASLDC
jgi:hypothetical protein